MKPDLNRRALIGFAGAAALATGAVAQAQEAFDDSDENVKEPESKIFQELLANKEVVQMQTPSGAKSASIHCRTDGPKCSKDKDVPYVVPRGYVRYDAKFHKEHSQGDAASAGWASSNPKNGTVHLHVRASGIHGYAKASVSDAYAIRESALEKLDQLEKTAAAAEQPTPSK